MGKFRWCLHCERVSLAKDAQEGCPLCHAARWDIWPWAKVRRDNPTYPEFPTVSGRYPLYPLKG